jgi:hypothetical protein
MEGMQPPRRLRYWVESWCWIVVLIGSGCDRRGPRRRVVRVGRRDHRDSRAHAGGAGGYRCVTGRPASPVGKVVRRWGCSGLPRPEREPMRRYERERPGELLHRAEYGESCPGDEIHPATNRRLSMSTPVKPTGA